MFTSSPISAPCEANKGRPDLWSHSLAAALPGMLPSGQGCPRDETGEAQPCKKKKKHEVKCGKEEKPPGLRKIIELPGSCQEARGDGKMERQRHHPARIKYPIKVETKHHRGVSRQHKA